MTNSTTLTNGTVGINGTNGTKQPLKDRLSTFEVEMSDLIREVSSCSDFETRRRLSKMLMPAARKAETPGDFVWRTMFAVHEFAALRTAFDLQLAQKLAGAKDPSSGMSLEELSQATGADPILLKRIVRVLVALGVFDETAPEIFAVNEVSSFLSQEPSFQGGLKFQFDVMVPAAVKMPAYLMETNFANPKSLPGPFQRAFGDLTSFEYLMQHPSSMQDFSELMAGQRLHRFEWFDFYPVQTNLLDGLDQDGVLLVDVGGNRGFELQAFKKRFPQVRSKLVLQDLPTVLSTVAASSPEMSGIEVMAHDFFTEQPVKGARAYYFRSCFHDWPDDKAHEILRRIAEAMKCGYSKLIINDWVLPDTQCPLYPGVLDLTLLAGFCGMERTENQWRALIEGAGLGLKIAKIHAVPDTEACIEIVKTTE